MERCRSPASGIRSDDIHRVTVLVNRATASSSNREKNAFLNQLRKISNDQLQKLDGVREQSEEKKRTLEDLRKQYDEFQERMKVLNLRAETLKLLKKRGNLVILKDAAAKIHEIEKEVSTFGPVEKPLLVDNCLNSKSMSEPEKAMMLDDLRMQRIEELIHFLERRLLSFELNKEYAEQIMAEFGSVFRLLDVFKTFQMENEKLKSYESNFAVDAVTRRRISQKICSTAARSMAQMFQNELKFQHYALGVLGASEIFELCRANSVSKFSLPAQKRVPKTRSVIGQGFPEAPPRPSTTVDAFMKMRLNFDQVCKDPEFKMTTDVTIMPSGMADAPQVLKLSAPEAITAIEGQSKLVKEQLEQLEKTLAQKRECVVKVDSASRNRLSKLEATNQQLLQDMVRIQEEITKRNVEVEEILKDLERALKEKNACEKRYVSCFEPFRALLSEHNGLRERQDNNRAVIQTLYSMCCLLGSDLLGDTDIMDTPLSQLLVPQIDEEVAILKEAARIREEQNKKPPKTKKRKTASRKGGLTVAEQFARILGKPEILESARTARSQVNPETARTEQEEEVEPPPKRPRDKFPLLSLLTQAVECGGCLGHPNAWHKKFVALWKDVEQQVRDLLREQLSSCESWQHENIETLNKYSSLILIKTHSNIDVQTEELRMGEGEVQTVDFKAEKKAAAEAKKNQKRSAKTTPVKK